MVLHFLKWLLRKIPLFGGLIDCRLMDHTEAFKEFFINLIFSTIPIWLGGAIIFTLDKTSTKTWPLLFETVVGTVQSGELFMYSTAMVAPIIYMALKPERGGRNFPGQMSHIFGIIIVALISVAFFSVERAGVVADRQITFQISVGLYLTSLVLLYMATVYRNYRLTGAADASREQTLEFVEEFNRRHQS